MGSRPQSVTVPAGRDPRFRGLIRSDSDERAAVDCQVITQSGTAASLGPAPCHLPGWTSFPSLPGAMAKGGTG